MVAETRHPREVVVIRYLRWHDRGKILFHVEIVLFGDNREMQANERAQFAESQAERICFYW